MARTAGPPPESGRMEVGGGFNNDPSSALRLNSLRISSCCNRLAVHLNTAPKNDPLDFFNTCFSLARGIDFAVASNKIPTGAQDLPFLLKQVCRLKDESSLPAAILVLMISIKNAVQRRWFSDEDSKELCRLTSELQSNFCTSMDFTTQPNNFNSTISTIMARYYPRVKMGSIIAFLAVKPGYGTYVHDFQITKELRSLPDEKIRLLVAQTNDIDTSSCLISPTDASFLINGRGVHRRCTNSTETGPQIPTLVNHYLKYGTNLLQAVGQFNGNFIIVIAFMRAVSVPDHAALQDYVQPTTSMVDSDPEITEGSSRISLNCPISSKRINVPVKGHMCKHLQCIDFKNYMEINVRRPSWRCPHCNQHLCFTDIRVDQNMVKILNEIGETVNSVLISSDGSWKPVTEIGGHCDKPRKEDTGFSTNPVDHEPSDIPPDDIMDLTEDDYMGRTEMCETADTKLFSSSCQNQSNQQGMSVNSHTINTNVANQNNVLPVEDNFRSGIYLSAHGSVVPRHTSGKPVSVQAVPVPSQTTYSLQQRQIYHPMIQNSSLVVPQTPGMPCIGDSASTVPGIMQGQQSFKRTILNPLQISCESSSRVQQSPVSQTVTHQTPSYGNSSYKLTPVFPSGNHISSQHPIPTMRENLNPSSLMTPSATSSHPSPADIVSDQLSLELTAQWEAKKARFGLASTTTSSYPINFDRHGAIMGGQRSDMPPSPPCPPVNSDVPMGMAALTTESNCRPSVGRMRGSLTGRARADAYNQYITQPTQQIQAARQQTKASSQPATATSFSTKSTSQPARATTQSSEATINPDSAKSHPPTQQDKATTQSATQQARATSQLAQAIHLQRTHASIQQVQAALQQAKSATPVSIANLLSHSASSRQEVLAANRTALAQAGIILKPGSGGSAHSCTALDQEAHRDRKPSGEN